MSKEILVTAVMDKLGGTKKDAEAAVKAVAEAIHETVSAGAEFRLAPLGSFRLIHKKQRDGRNPATGEAITIAARDVVTFKASKG